MVPFSWNHESWHERSNKLLKTYNLLKLSKELIAAGVCTDGNCGDDGVVFDDDGNQIQTRPDVVAILAAHNPDELVATPLTLEQRLEEAEKKINLLLSSSKNPRKP